MLRKTEISSEIDFLPWKNIIDKKRYKDIHSILDKMILKKMLKSLKTIDVALYEYKMYQQSNPTIKADR